MLDIFDERKQYMKKQYIYPSTSVSAIDCAWYLMESFSSNVDLDISNEKQDPGGALAPNRKIFY